MEEGGREGWREAHGKEIEGGEEGGSWKRVSRRLIGKTDG